MNVNGHPRLIPISDVLRELSDAAARGDLRSMMRLEAAVPFIADAFGAVEIAPHMDDDCVVTEANVQKRHPSGCSLCASMQMLADHLNSTRSGTDPVFEALVSERISAALGMIRNVDPDAYDNYEEAVEE